MKLGGINLSRRSGRKRTLDLTSRRTYSSKYRMVFSMKHQTATAIKEHVMSREAGDRYRCDKCQAELVYEKGCPCPASMPHQEICCGEQMKKVNK
jgi:hypothetical protein